MSKPLAFGLNLTKKAGASKPAPPKRNPLFGGDDDAESNDDNGGASKVEEIGGDLGDFGATTAASASDGPPRRPNPRSGAKPSAQPPKMNPSRSQPNAMFGDLSESLAARRNAEEASELDPSVYEYDAVYDSLKPKKPEAKAEKDLSSKYIRRAREAAAQKQDDRNVAEDKKTTRERAAEGDKFADKESFVTSSFLKQKEERKRQEEENRQKEERDAKNNQSGGMYGLNRDMLNREHQRHAEVVKAAEEAAKVAKNGAAGVTDREGADAEDQDEGQEDTRRAKELNDKGADIAINDEGQVVNKRELLKGGLNLGAKRKDSRPRQDEDDRGAVERDRRLKSGQHIGSQQARRERQTRMMEEQLEKSMKRNSEEAEIQKKEVERAAKSRKTDGEISSAKERYLARKAAENAKTADGRE